MVANELPLHSQTPLAWGEAVLADTLPLLSDHAILEKKAAANALELLTRWPFDYVPGWVETMTGVARDETVHLAQVTRLLFRRGGQLEKGHTNPYAKALRGLVRPGGIDEAIDRLLVSSLIEVRSCERFAVLAQAAADTDPELAKFYDRLYKSEFGHYTTFLNLAQKLAEPEEVLARWQTLLAEEAAILARQKPGPRMHSGM
ncbi:MAG: tRNA-(ms[2]io[6]A)-hydroxylase [Bryobacter sp.]|nr:tRNA-(ms[2]io[6]A)-hydroxylase [Bryobacter sp.]